MSMTPAAGERPPHAPGPAVKRRIAAVVWALQLGGGGLLLFYATVLARRRFPAASSCTPCCSSYPS